MRLLKPGPEVRVSIVQVGLQISIRRLLTVMRSVKHTGELGIRMALGAQSRDVLWLVLGKGAVLVVIGAFLGAVGAYAVSKLLISLIPSLPTRDPLIMPIAALALVAVALVACYIPARRATRVDPLVALRSE